MPQIIIETDNEGVTWRERITSSDLESGHFRTQLLERLRWAVSDAHNDAPPPPSARTRGVSRPATVIRSSAG